MSKIEWTGETWNPVVGCSVVSPGCTNCYAMRMAARMEAMGDAAVKAGRTVPGPHYAGTTRWVNGKPVWTGKVALAPDHILTAPLRRRTPTTYFVNSMSDLFHEDVPDGWILRVFAVMALCPQHTFQILTKRSARMRAVLSAASFEGLVSDKAISYWQPGTPNKWRGWPLPNVWLGVSTEDQRRADERIPDLLATSAAVRFVSAEPLLGPINLVLLGEPGESGGQWPSISWVIVGGESGLGAREFKLGWACDIVRQCQQANVAVFVKQIGARPTYAHDGIELPVTIRDRKGGDMSEWPESLQVREMPEVRT